jgi:hypothetical protein
VAAGQRAAPEDDACLVQRTDELSKIK